MILFFRTPTKSVIATEVSQELASEDIQKLSWLYGEATVENETQGIPPPCRGLRRMEPRGDDWCHADPHRRRRRNPADHHPFATGGLLTQGRRGHHPIQPS